MTVYRLVVFFHVAALAGLFVALGAEGIALARTRQATTYEEARPWAQIWKLLMPIGMPSILISLASGVYLATTIGAWELGWVHWAVPTLVVVAIAGAIVGPRRSRLLAALEKGSGPLPGELRLPSSFIASWRVRAALLTALVFEMTARPDGILAGVALGSFAVLGAVWGAAGQRSTSRANSA